MIAAPMVLRTSKFNTEIASTKKNNINTPLTTAAVMFEILTSETSERKFK